MGGMGFQLSQPFYFFKFSLDHSVHFAKISDVEIFKTLLFPVFFQFPTKLYGKYDNQNGVKAACKFLVELPNFKTLMKF